MDTALLLANLMLLTVALLLVILLALRKETTKTSTASPNYLLSLLTEQIRETRRLTNLLISRNTQDFHAIHAVSPENVGTSPLPMTQEQPEPEGWGSDGVTADIIAPEFPTDEGFYGDAEIAPHRGPVPR